MQKGSARGRDCRASGIAICHKMSTRLALPPVPAFRFCYGDLGVQPSPYDRRVESRTQAVRRSRLRVSREKERPREGKHNGRSCDQRDALILPIYCAFQGQRVPFTFCLSQTGASVVIRKVFYHLILIGHMWYVVDTYDTFLALKSHSVRTGDNRRELESPVVHSARRYFLSTVRITPRAEAMPVFNA